ncbi:MAG TPA: hypothetical protein VNU92_03720 [Edaphobacter sp.]|jgi:hypothetical protein|nr:hypothetical protein [Edaphobacter sp.]
MSSMANTNDIATANSKKPNTKHELIVTNIKLLIEQLEGRTLQRLPAGFRRKSAQDPAQFLHSQFSADYGE